MSQNIQHDSSGTWHRWSPIVASQQGATAKSGGPDRLALRGMPTGAPKLADLCAVVLGLGAVGGPCFSTLGRLGVGRLIGVDPDCYGRESWLTQPCETTHTDQPKAVVQGLHAHNAGPASETFTFQGIAQDLPLAVLDQADVLVLAGDNLDLAVWAGRMAAMLGKPLVQGAVDGESWLAVVRGFDLRDADNTCPACRLSKLEWSTLKTRHSCDPSVSVAPAQFPTRTLPHICGTAGHLLASEALKYLLGVESGTLRGEELAYCLLTHLPWRSGLDRNLQCRCPHRRWKTVQVSKPPSDATLRELISARECSVEEVQVRGERQWVASVSCTRCRKARKVHRFGNVGQELAPCTCGQPLKVSPLDVRSILPAEDVNDCLDVLLSVLGILPGEAIGLTSKNGEQATYYFIGQLLCASAEGCNLSSQEENHE